jgi:hypothetical protein
LTRASIASEPSQKAAWSGQPFGSGAPPRGLAQKGQEDKRRLNVQQRNEDHQFCYLAARSGGREVQK